MSISNFELDALEIIVFMFRQQGFYLNFFNEDLKFCTNLIKFIMILI